MNKTLRALLSAMADYGTRDIYTDANECEEAVATAHTLAMLCGQAAQGVRLTKSKLAAALPPERFTVRPLDFTQSQWEEAYNCCPEAAGLLEEEMYHDAEPVELTRGEIRMLARACRDHAKNLPVGGSAGENACWREDLRDAARVLTAALREGESWGKGK